MDNKKMISVVGPVFNEQECIEEFHRKLSEAFEGIRYEVEFLFVDDGSSDETPQILSRLQQKDARIKVLTFSRNFGHQIAIKAGIDHAIGDAVVLMDTDLQDPPSVVIEMIRRWEEGYDVVYAVRSSREGEGLLKKITAKLYYRLMKKLSNVDIPLDAGDFRLISRPVADAIKSINESKPYLRGLISWVGYRQIGVTMKRDPRHAGKTKFSWPKMLRFAWSGITHFSFLPLQIATFVGSIAALACLIWFGHILYVTFILKTAVAGWASIMVAVLFLGSVQLITLGILGSYLAKNYEETRSRPLYLIQSKQGFPSEQMSVPQR